MKLHKFCKLFPKMDGEDFKKFTLDIKQNGLGQPITTLNGAILDGQNRYAACVAAGVTPEFTEYVGDDPLQFVISRNMNRRHLTDDQRAAIAAGIADHQGGTPANPARVTTAEAAAALKVSQRQVQRAKSVKKESRNHYENVKAGKESLNHAHQATRSKKKAPARGGLAAQALAVEDSVPVVEAEQLKPESLDGKILNAEKILPTEFRDILLELEQRINATCHSQQAREMYGVHANALAGRLMNPIEKKVNFYTP